MTTSSSSSQHVEENKYALRKGSLDLPYIPRRGYADGPYGQVHYRDNQGGGTGSDDKTLPLILCHMAPQTSKQFSAVYELFKKRGVRAIGVDCPGFGESDPTPFVPSIQDWAPAVVAVLDHLGIEKAHLLGHHTGSKVACEVALQFPERVGKLVLQGPTPYPEEERLKALQYVKEEEIGMAYKADGSHLSKGFEYRTKRWNDVVGRADPQLFTRYFSEKFQGYAPFWTGHHAAYIYDDAASLKRIRHQTLLLTNTGDVSIHRHVKKAHEEIRPDLDYLEINGGTGDIVDQMPHEWTEAVASFIKKD